MRLVSFISCGGRKTRQENALGQVFKGIVEGRKSPKHDLYRGTDGYYVNEMLITAPCQR